MRTQTLASYVATVTDAYRRLPSDVDRPEARALLVLAGVVAQAGERLVVALQARFRPAAGPAGSGSLP